MVGRGQMLRQYASRFCRYEYLIWWRLIRPDQAQRGIMLRRLAIWTEQGGLDRPSVLHTDDPCLLGLHRLPCDLLRSYLSYFLAASLQIGALGLRILGYRKHGKSPSQKQFSGRHGFQKRPGVLKLLFGLHLTKSTHTPQLFCIPSIASILLASLRKPFARSAFQAVLRGVPYIELYSPNAALAIGAP